MRDLTQNVGNVLTIQHQTCVDEIFKCTIFVGYGGVIFFTGVPPAGDKTKTIKAGRDLFQRLLVSQEAGRDINLEEILCHELSTTHDLLVCS